MLLLLKGDGRNLWTPSLLSNTKAWYVADDPGNTVSGGLTTVLKDKAGTSDATAVRGGAVMSDTLNGRSTLRVTGGDGVFQSLSAGTAIGSEALGVSFFVVNRFTSRDGSDWPAVAATMFGTSGATLQVALMRSEVGTDWPEGSISLRTRPRWDGAGLEIGSSTNYGTGWMVAGASRRFNHDDGSIWVNGTEVVSETMDAENVTAEGDLSLVVGGYTVEDADYVTQNIAEIVAVRDDISTDDRQRLEGYLAWQWGLQALLPVGHPYKGEPPYVIVTNPVDLGAVLVTGSGSISASITNSVPLFASVTGTGSISTALSNQLSLGSLSITGHGEISAVLSVDGEEPVLPVRGGGYPFKIKLVDRPWEAKDEAEEDENEEGEEAIAEAEPEAPVIVVEPDREAMGALAAVLSPPVPSIDIEAIRAQLLQVQQEAALAQEEELAAQFLLQLVAQRRRSFLSR